MSMQIDASDVERLAARIRTAANVRRPFLAARLRVDLRTLADAAEKVYAQETPVRTGALQASTKATVVQDSDLDAHIEVRQPATNRRGDEYVQWVVFPHRIVTRSGVDTGRKTRGNLYPTRAEARIREPFAQAMAAAGHAVNLETIHAMKVT